ncbi:type IV secretory system conjugative DNA transfer family protein [Aliarcobacter cryaerophilus]|uniref:type IV secretory system conjugative DNA transfer family protein n=1 Tax=Aliarcobacter cryaerophilus TaxID=28198 RepID=UPI0028CBBEA1|nr:type IV secretory system conjugative DNA transfer family protein [Aliarcobacter cryaerophilus]
MKLCNFMDNLFAFHKLYLEGKLEPPKIGVVSEPIQITKEGKVMIIQQEYMEIIEPAKFVNQPKTWRNFILD